MYQYFIAEWFCHWSLNFSELHSPHLWKGGGFCLWRMTVRSVGEEWVIQTSLGSGCSLQYTPALCFPPMAGGDFVTMLLLLNAHWCHLVWAPWWTFFALVQSVKACFLAPGYNCQNSTSLCVPWGKWLCWRSLSCDRGRSPTLQVDPIKWPLPWLFWC